MTNPDLLSAALILAPALCNAQAGRAELFGAIRDPSGLPVAHAKVEAEDQATMARYASLSDATGDTISWACRPACTC
jgi:hypothetical protein